MIGSIHCRNLVACFTNAAFIRLAHNLHREGKHTHFCEHRATRIYYWKIHINRLRWIYKYLKQICSLHLADYSMEDKTSMLSIILHYVFQYYSFRCNGTSILVQFITCFENRKQRLNSVMYRNDRVTRELVFITMNRPLLRNVHDNISFRSRDKNRPHSSREKLSNTSDILFDVSAAFLSATLRPQVIDARNVWIVLTLRYTSWMRAV